VPRNVLFHFIAIGQLALYLILDWQPRILADERQDLIDRPEQLLSLFRAYFALGIGGFGLLALGRLLGLRFSAGSPESLHLARWDVLSGRNLRKGEQPASQQNE